MITVVQTRTNGDLLELEFTTSDPSEMIVIAEPTRNSFGKVVSIRLYAPNPGAVCTMGPPLTPTASPLKVQGPFLDRVKIVTQSVDGAESECEVPVSQG